jgi:hypothetical protein
MTARHRSRIHGVNPFSRHARAVYHIIRPTTTTDLGSGIRIDVGALIGAGSGVGAASVSLIAGAGEETWASGNTFQIRAMGMFTTKTPRHQGLQNAIKPWCLRALVVI